MNVDLQIEKRWPLPPAPSPQAGRGRHVLAIIVVLLACAARASDDPDVDHVRDAYLRSILPSDPQRATQVTKLAQDLAAALQPDGTWADVDYKNQARSMW